MAVAVDLLLPFRLLPLLLLILVLTCTGSETTLVALSVVDDECCGFMKLRPIPNDTDGGGNACGAAPLVFVVLVVVDDDESPVAVFCRFCDFERSSSTASQCGLTKLELSLGRLLDR